MNSHKRKEVFFFFVFGLLMADIESSGQEPSDVHVISKFLFDLVCVLPTCAYVHTYMYTFVQFTYVGVSAVCAVYVRGCVRCLCSLCAWVCPLFVYFVYYYDKMSGQKA